MHDGKFKHFSKTKPSITHTDRKPDSLLTMWTLHKFCSMLALLIQKWKKVNDHGMFVWTSKNPQRSLIEVWFQMHISCEMIFWRKLVKCTPWQRCTVMQIACCYSFCLSWNWIDHILWATSTQWLQVHNSPCVLFHIGCMFRVHKMTASWVQQLWYTL